jgi:hypothetical protein
MDTATKILTVILLVLLVVCGFTVYNEAKIVEANKVKNFYAIISETNFDEQSFSSGKSKVPQLCNSVLFKVIDGEYKNQYFKLNSCSAPGCFILTDSWVYNHKRNDTVFFKYVNKERFFQIKER